MIDIGTRGGKRLTLPVELERDRVLLITTQYLHRCVSIKTSPSIHSSIYLSIHLTIHIIILIQQMLQFLKPICLFRGVEILSRLPDILNYFHHSCAAPHILCIQYSLKFTSHSLDNVLYDWLFTQH